MSKSPEIKKAVGQKKRPDLKNELLMFEQKVRKSTILTPSIKRIFGRDLEIKSQSLWFGDVFSADKFIVLQTQSARSMSSCSERLMKSWFT